MLIDFDLSTALLGIILLLFIVFYLKNKKDKDLLYLFFFSVFYLYLLGVLKYTIFPIPIGSGMAEIMRRELKFSSGINLIPFDINIVNEQVLYNILLTVPFGFGLPFLLNVTKIRLMIYGVSFCVVIESLQLIISLFLGFPYRTIDINDVILNVFGVILGFMVFKVFGFLFKKMVNNLDIKKSPFLKYIEITINKH